MSRDWHLLTQNQEYLEVSKNRLNDKPLIWVEQFTEIINSRFRRFETIAINDIGCNVGHFARNVSKLKPKVEYKGLDISNTYLEIARQNFPQYKFVNIDFSQKNIVKNEFRCDISIVSATLEHVKNYKIFLKNIFETTKQLVIIRTFLGQTTKNNLCFKQNALSPYLIRQFTQNDLIQNKYNLDWKHEFKTDKATKSKWKSIENSIRRRQMVIIYKIKTLLFTIELELHTLFNVIYLI